MPRFRSNGLQLVGSDLTLVNPTFVRFAAYVETTYTKPQGTMRLTLGVPFDQIPNAMSVLREIGGVMFEVTMRRVPFDELPEGGWE
jgi:hypothetical protein